MFTLGFIPFVAVGIIKLVKASKTTFDYYSDQEFDENVANGIHDIKEKALLALGLDESEVTEIEPIHFDGFSFKGAEKIRKGDDGLYRTDKYESVIIFFSANEVHYYKYIFSTTSDWKTEETNVYFYKDVVSVATAFDEITVLGQTITNEFFKMTTTGGTTLSVSLRNKSDAQRSINAMRALLKEKKQG